MTFVAATSWPEAAIAMAAIGGLAVVISVALWQVFATGRGAIANEGANEYRQLAEELAAMQRETTAELQRSNEALAQLRAQTQELGRGLEELDRILKAVE